MHDEQRSSDDIERIVAQWPGRVLVTGCAGFIGSHLSERLIDAGVEVVGVDCFTDYYDRRIKQRNLERLLQEPGFAMHRVDLSEDDLADVVDGVSVVIHLAGQPGVRASFGEGFAGYVRHNVLATQRLLEATVRHDIRRFVYASSSSVYGNAPAFPTSEETVRAPVSPYGMTKLATEEVAAVYTRNFGLHTVGLRFFTVYGPRQRPDMAFTRFLRRAVAGEPLPVLGAGLQVRDFSYVADIVAGTIAATAHGRSSEVYNLGGGQPVRLIDALRLIEELVGRRLRLEHRPIGFGEAARTGCDGMKARDALGFVPGTRLRDGLARQLQWILETQPVADPVALVA